MAEQMQTMVINSWLEMPRDVEVRCYKGDGLEVAKQKFREKYGLESMVAFQLRDQWLLVVDPDARLEQEKV
jgi:hypothetical protein